MKVGYDLAASIDLFPCRWPKRWETLHVLLRTVQVKSPYGWLHEFSLDHLVNVAGEEGENQENTTD